MSTRFSATTLKRSETFRRDFLTNTFVRLVRSDFWLEAQLERYLQERDGPNKIANAKGSADNGRDYCHSPADFRLSRRCSCECDDDRFRLPRCDSWHCSFVWPCGIGDRLHYGDL